MSDEIDPAAEADAFLQAYAAGDKRALWQAVVYCAAHRIPLWDWLGDGLLLIDNAAEAGEIRSFDDVFGKPWGRGQRRGRQSWAKRYKVFDAVRKAATGGGTLKAGEELPINNKLFDQVAKKFKFKRSTVGRLYAPLVRAIRDSERDQRD
jgi:hypothetical protein